MVQKRSFDDEAPHEASFKLRRQEKLCDQPALLPGYHFSENACFMANPSGKQGEWSLQKAVGEDEMSYGTRKPPLSYRNYSSQASEDRLLLGDFCIPFPHEQFYPDRRTIVWSHSDDSYGWLLRNPPQKVVPIGPDYQADIPAWSQVDCKDNLVTGNKSLETTPDFAPVDDTEGKLAGICITPMPDFEISESDNDLIGAGRSDCSCQDKGSTRCVRQHIVEAREKLRINFGEEVFFECACHDVGEQVADTWLDEEEELFQEVVFSYPSSTGKSFWNYLSSAFPSRTRGEIGHYYYNVFLLQRRAKQNRSDPSNIDSDDDEWHASDEEDEDSAVESPEEVGPGGYHSLEEIDESDGDIAEETCTYSRNASADTAHGRADAAETRFTKLIDKDQGAQDDSCTSFESVDALTGDQITADNGDPWPDAEGHDYVIGSGDVKFWDGGDLSCLSREVDFLPTFSMIEEAFGDEPWNFKPDS